MPLQKSLEMMTPYKGKNKTKPPNIIQKNYLKETQKLPTLSTLFFTTCGENVVKTTLWL